MSSILSLAPYAVEGLKLAQELLQMAQGDPSAEDLEALKKRFEQSQRDRDQAITELDKLIADKRR